MQVRSLELFDFRNYAQAQIEFHPGLTLLTGANGQGKTNLIEAVGFASGTGSIRGAIDKSMVKDGCDAAVIRCETLVESRDCLIEARVQASGRNQIQLNRQRITRLGDLREALTTTVFSPDDLEIIKAGPVLRRDWIDEACQSVDPTPQRSELFTSLERILRQRNTLLRQISGRLDDTTTTTLDVWDAQLSEVGDQIRQIRTETLSSLEPYLQQNYASLATAGAQVELRYESSWDDEPLAAALLKARQDDVRRAATTIGPHRDDVVIMLNGLPARTHASQGEQRSLALALRLATDAEVRASRNINPVLLLDDVFSELDPQRAQGLLDALPSSQCIVTTASQVPADAVIDQSWQITAGTITPASPMSSTSPVVASMSSSPSSSTLSRT